MLKVWIWVLSILTIFAIACAPRAAPAPMTTPAPAAPALPAKQPAPAEDEAWAKVVEAAKKEGVVVVYSTNLAGEAGIVVARAFKNRYGVKAEIVGGTSPVLVERIRTEYRVGQLVADIADLSAGRIFELKGQGMSVSLKDLPVLQDRKAWYPGRHPFDLDPDGHILNFTSTIVIVCANTQLVKPIEEPKSWLDLLDPKWKGKLIVGEPALNQTPTFVYYGLVTKSGRLTDEYFRSLGGQIKKFIPGGVAAVAAALARGEGHIDINCTTTGAGPLVKEGAPVKALQMKEGNIAPPGAAPSLISKAPHPNASRLFLNWFLSAEGLRVWAEAVLRETNRQDVPDFAPSALRTDASKWVAMDFADMDKTNDMYNAGFMNKLWKGETGK